MGMSERDSVCVAPYDLLSHVEGEVVESLEELLGTEGLGALQGPGMRTLAFRGAPMDRPLEVSVKVADGGIVRRQENGAWVWVTFPALGSQESESFETCLDAVRALLDYMASWCDLHEAPEGLEYLWEASLYFRADGDVLPC